MRYRMGKSIDRKWSSGFQGPEGLLMGTNFLLGG